MESKWRDFLKEFGEWKQDWAIGQRVNWSIDLTQYNNDDVRINLISWFSS